MIIEFSYARNRYSKEFRQLKWSWEQLSGKLGAAKRTPETADEYHNKFSKADRAKAKDSAGCFIGGSLKDGLRRKANMEARSLITLDVDHLPAGRNLVDWWDDFTLARLDEAVLYTTHSHTPKSPRFRIVMPLSREVDATEYEAIARRVAGDAGIEDFDPTTFECTRIFYFPSCPTDGEFIFLHQEGEAVDADKELARYTDYTDVKEWPGTKPELAILKARAAVSGKQADPETKKGVVGDFCRSYPIEDVIDEFLSDVYKRDDSSGRYTYINGTSANGGIVYEGKWFYSCHSTDPACGRLCNAFDLVRIHKFGAEDMDAEALKAEDAGTEVCLPSFKLMEDFARNTDRVKELEARSTAERQKEALKEFGVPMEELHTDEDDEDLQDDVEWLKKLEAEKRKTGTGAIMYRPTARNLDLIFKNDRVLKNIYGWNAFSQRGVIMKPIPWREVMPKQDSFTDPDEAQIRGYLESQYGIASDGKVQDALMRCRMRNAFHPIKEYLECLQWDGTPRMDSLLVDYYGAEDNIYVREVTRAVLLAAIARVYQPGCKWDSVMILKGKQGTGKSTLVSKLGGPWGSDDFSFALLGGNGNKDEEQVQGKWIIEMGELNGLRKADMENVKMYVSKRSANYRDAYGKNPYEHRRQCIFIGTTNQPLPLRDATGNRRFWPVNIDVQESVKDRFNDLTFEVINQIWAEAFHIYNVLHAKERPDREGEYRNKFLLLSEEATSMAQEEQGASFAEDPRAEDVRRYLDTPLPEDWKERDLGARRAWYNSEYPKEGAKVQRKVVRMKEIWCECFMREACDMTRKDSNEIMDIMLNFKDWRWGVTKSQDDKIYGRRKHFFRVMTEVADDEPNNEL